MATMRIATELGVCLLEEKGGAGMGNDAFPARTELAVQVFRETRTPSHLFSRCRCAMSHTMVLSFDAAANVVGKDDRGCRHGNLVHNSTKRQRVVWAVFQE